MKKWIVRAGALALALHLTVGTALGAEVLHRSALPLADSLHLTSHFVGGETPVRENILAYTPGGDVSAVVAYGSTLYGRSTMDYIEAGLSRQGLTAVGAINGAFFDMRNGLPMGVVVTDGILRINGYDNAVGIREDGSVLIGAPEAAVCGRWGDHEILLHYNQLLVGTNGMILYSADYDTQTKGQTPARHVVLEASEPRLRLGGSVTATVTKIVERAKSCPIPENGFVLSLAEEETYAPFREAINDLQVGDSVTFSAEAEPDWQTVRYAVGGGDLLVENGRALDTFTLDSAARPAARTALGIRADGQVVCYTVDRGAASHGMTLPQLAERMAELDCVTAINLDGGGSTCLGVTQPGEDRFTTVNVPSDGAQRACANYLFFVRPTTAAAGASRLFVYPYDQAILPGGQLQLTARAADDAYMPAALPGSVSWSSGSGTVVDGLLTAGRAGTYTVTAYSGALTGSVQIHVVETPTAMEVLRQDTGKPVESLVVECGTGLDLTANAWYLGMELTARDQSFGWSVPEALGTLDEAGRFTAGAAEAAGLLTVRCGGRSVEIPVQTRINPMVDVDGHWAREPISQLYFRNVLKGSENEAGEMIYRPDASMTRQEFVVALIRWLGIDTAAYADEPLPFADAAAVADWAAEAMQAAAALGYFTGSAGAGGKVYAEPNATVTREAAMTILARSCNASSQSDALEEFPDETQVSDWARPALTTMVEQGVINGIDGRLQPRGNVTRAQVAKMLYTME